MAKVLISLSLIFLFYPQKIISQNNHSLSAGVMLYNYDYKEILTLPLKSTHNGFLTGWYFGYRYDNNSVPIFFRLTSEYTPSNIKYDGSTQDGEPLTDNIHIKLFRSELNAGYTFLFQTLPDFTFDLYSGASYRSWKRGFNIDSFDMPPEFYTWWEIPIGGDVNYNLGKGFQIGTEIKYRFMIKGEIEVDLSGRYWGLNSMKMKLGNKAGLKVQIPLTYRIMDHFSVGVNPWYEYSAIGKSNEVQLYWNGYLVGYAYEPSSSTNQFGATLFAQLYFHWF